MYIEERFDPVNQIINIDILGIKELKEGNAPLRETTADAKEGPDGLSLDHTVRMDRGELEDVTFQFRG